MSYSVFAQYYDVLTRNADYQKRADYLCDLLKHYQHDAGTILDLACGTGSLTLRLKQRGFDIFGVDNSIDMLTRAQQKANAAGENILFLHQQMQSIDLYGFVDTVICTLDSLNHLPMKIDVEQTFQRVSHFLVPGGLFIFDMNTPYKHRTILGNHTFIYDTEDVYCIWQNHYQKEGCRVGITLDFFERDGAVYKRKKEHFYERAYSQDQITEILKQAGLQLIDTFAEMTFQPPTQKAERIVYIAQKPLTGPLICE